MMFHHLPRIEDLRHLIWLQTSFLGDIVLTTAALNVAKKCLPHVKQHVITTPTGEAALRGHRAIFQTILFDKRKKGLGGFRDVMAKCRWMQRHETVLLLPHRSIRSSLLASYLSYPSIGYHESPLGLLNAQRVSRVSPLHEAARIGLLLEPLGISREAIVTGRPSLEQLPFTGEEEWAKKIPWSKKNLIAVAPGSVWGTKRWPIENYAKVVERFLLDPEIHVLVLGSADEGRYAKQLVAKVKPSGRLWDLTGRTNLQDLRRIYPHLKLLVANDSSPVHYASAFDVPTVAIFGATAPSLGFGPLATQSQVVEVELNCRPCSDHGPQVCPLGHFQCMRRITVDDVFAACSKMLSAENTVAGVSQPR